MYNNQKPNFFLAAILLIFAILPMTAHAGLLTQVTQLLSGNISPNDESVAMLRNVFGSFALDPFNTGGGAAGGGGSGVVLGAMFKQYNMFIFTVAMLWFTWTAIASLAQTMHEGVVFGQRMSTVWLPIRIAFGSVSLMPIFGGWAFCQALMMIAALLGIAGANSITKEAINSSANFQTVVNPMGGVKQAAALHDIEVNMLHMAVCQKAASLMAIEAANNKVTMSGNPGNIVDAVPKAGLTSIVMAFPSKEDAASAGCGTITLNFSPRKNTGIGSVMGFRIEDINYEGIRKISIDAHMETLTALYIQAKGIAENASNDPSAQPNVAANFIGSGFFDNYNTVFQAKLAALQVSMNGTSNASAINQKLKEKMIDGGWATLGIWYSVFAEINEAMNEMLDPTVKFITYAPQSSKETDLLNRTISSIEQAAKVDANANTSATASATTSATASATGDLSVGQWLLGGALNGLVGGSATGANNSVNPILVMKNIGDNTIVLAETIYVVSKFVGAGSSSADDKPGVVSKVTSSIASAANKIISKIGLGRISSTIGAIFSDIGALAFPLTIALFAVGMTMSFYLPMLPFIQWFAALAHWFITIVESFLGASLWALAHFDSDGEGMGQRASYGYQYMLSNFARPIIMTFAFFFASAAITVLGTFLFKYFGSAVASAQGNTLTGLLSILAYLVIMGVMAIALVNNCFGIMLKIADTIIGFVGSSAASAFQNDHEQRINGMFVAAIRGGTGAMNQRTGGRPTAGKLPGDTSNKTEKPGLTPAK